MPSEKEKAIQGLIEISRELADAWKPGLGAEQERYMLAEHIGGLKVLLKRVDESEEN